jgi:hypothetical protein
VLHELQHRLVARLFHSQVFGNRRDDQSGVTDRRQVHEEHAIGEPARYRFCGGDGQASLADSRRPGEGQEAHMGRGLQVIDFTQSGGITFVDTILISIQQAPQDSPPLWLVFHELVHVVQYDAVGVDEFVSRYVRGRSAHGQEYSSIPIERQAYESQARYEANPSAGFSVWDHVHCAGVP